MLIYLQMIDLPQDRSKFEKIYDLYRQRMYHIAMRILHNERDAEDAVHEAFIAIAKNILKFSDPECPKTACYIVTIVESKAIDIYRRKKRHPLVPMEELQGMTVEYEGSNELARCMAQLPARYRQVLVLKFAHGYSTLEIAQMLGLTPVNVHKLEQRAKAKLEKLCKEAGIL